jgi:hypothetical protein
VDAAVTPRGQSAQDSRIEAQVSRIAAAKRRVIDLTLERASVEEALATFEHEYAARVGSLYGELDRVQLDIKELLYRARLVEKGITRDAAHLERRVETAFRRERERIEGDPASGDDSTTGRRRNHDSSHRRATPRAGDARELRRLYLALAKRYHPDKTGTVASEIDVERLMGLINEAYDASDLRRLRQIAATLDDGDEPTDERADAKERRLFRESLELDRAARDVERELERLKQRDAYGMMRDAEEAQARGDDLVGALRADLVAKLDAARTRLSSIRSQFETLATATFAAFRR